jgi:hypothetical protein
LLPWWIGGAFLQRMLKGGQPGDSPTPNQDPALSAKVTTGGHPTIFYPSIWRCPHLQMEGKVPPPMD